MEKSTDKLREAYRTAMETETVGAQVMQDLHEQRQTLERSRGRLSKAGAGLARTSRVLKTMGRRALANKLLLWFMIAFLLLMIMMLIYLELFGNSTASASPPPPMPEMVEDSR
jgi:vesicle transport through interaction with t-SNAREs protein 1|tara:strand:+ start:433 stop:771 length:339 start_codon:yes stop_codon:yes gene_type:complete